MKAEEEARLTDESRLKLEEHQRVHLKVDEGVRLVLESRRIAEEDQEEHQHARLKAE